LTDDIFVIKVTVVIMTGKKESIIISEKEKFIVTGVEDLS